MTQWPVVRMSDVCREITVGHVGKMSDRYVPSGVPFLRSQDINPGWIDFLKIKFIPDDFHRQLLKSRLSPGDVVIVRTGYPGTAAVVPESLRQANCADLVIVRPGPTLDPYFLAYVMNSPWGRGVVRGSLVGVAQQHFNVKVAAGMKLRLPPPPIQCRITSILRAYDDLIEVNRRRIAVLEEMARRLFDEWFFHYRFPGHEVHEIVSTANGRIPAGWRWAPLQDMLVLQRGFDLPSSAREPGDFPLVTASGINGMHSEGRIPAPGIVTGRSGTIGSVFLIYEDFWPLNTTLYVKEFRRATPTYALHLLRKLDLKSRAAGAAVPTLNRNHIHGIPVACPPLALVQEFERQASTLLQMVHNLERSQVRLCASRDLLLPRLISGDLPVAAGETELERAA